MKKRVLVAVVALSFVVAAGASESRSHYVVVEKNLKPAFEVTRIHDAAPTTTTRTFLIGDIKGPLLRVDILSDYGNRKRVTTLRALKGARSVATIVVDLPFASTTPADRVREIHDHPELENAPVPITISGDSARRSYRDVDASWHHADRAANARSRAAEVVGGELMSTLSAVKELAGLPMFADLNTALGYLLPSETLVHRSAKLLVATETPNCTFDAAFGLPCK